MTTEQTKLDQLTSEERTFYELIKARPGAKLNGPEAYGHVGPLWPKLVFLNLIEDTGSFKWKVVQDTPTVDTEVSVDSKWPMLDKWHLQALMFAYNEGYSKAYERRVFKNPFTTEGSQAAAWELGTKEGTENRDHDDAIRATINSKANRDELLLINKKQELDIAENDRLIDQLRAELEDVQGLYQAHLKECYRYLGIDGSDGEYRSKWVLLELANLTRAKKEGQ